MILRVFDVEFSHQFSYALVPDTVESCLHVINIEAEIMLAL